MTSIILIISLVFFGVAIWAVIHLCKISAYTQDEINRILKDDGSENKRP